MVIKSKNAVWKMRVVVLSLLLIFVALPHTLEDFALGEPAKNGVPAPLLAGIIAGLFALQAWGLFDLGRDQRRGYFIQMGIGIFWPLAAGTAQLPAILTLQPYRFGFISLHYVIGMIILGILLLFASIQGLRAASLREK
jgi:hypothetical protein